MSAHLIFVEDDLVRLKNTEYIQSSVIYNATSPNVFKISEIVGDQIKLAYVENFVPACEIEPIPINGVDDKCIYYDPIIAASIVAPGQPIPEHNRDYSYYLDSFKNNIVEERTLREIINEHDFQFVHEIQHYLRSKYHTDDLEIKYNW